MLFDHVGLSIKDFAKSKAFYLQALTPLGMKLTQETPQWAMIGRRGEGDLWFGAFGPPTSPLHIAFSATSREQVRQFHAAAVAAGGRDNGAPGLRPKYHPNYYGAYVIDLDGHNIEAVCHAPEA